MHIPDYYEFYNKTQICSGKKALEGIPFMLKSMNAVKPLVVTDAWTADHGYIKVFVKSFYDSGMTIGAIFDRVHRYPSATIVKKLASLYRDRGCDSIIAIGGSSPAAVAKGLNIAVSNRTDELLNFSDMSKSAKLSPFIYIPTSDASGTEISGEAVVDSRVFKSADLMPDVAVIDSRMTGKTDIQHIVNAGLLGLVQSIESCNVSVSNVVNDSFAHASIALIKENFNAAVKGFFKRKQMAAFVNGVVISGITYTNAPEGLARAIGYEAEKMTGFPAGVCAGIVLPYLLDYKLVNLKSGVRGELLLPLAGIDTYCATPENDRPRAGVDALYGILDSLDNVVPQKLRLMNIPEYMISRIADAAGERTGKLYPKGTAHTVLEHAYNGIKFGGGR